MCLDVTCGPVHISRGGSFIVPYYENDMNVGNSQLKWYAARIIRERIYVLKYLDSMPVEHAGIADLKSLLFIHTTRESIALICSDLHDRVLFYRNASRTALEAVPDQVMRSFLIMAPFHDEPVIYISVDNPHFFEGPRKRVKSGVFAGCEGVIRRIKGERRLIVRISDRAAIATPYIPRELLEDIQ